MKVEEKIVKERENTDKIMLYSDGSKFVRAYNNSAFAFSKQVHQYKVLAALNKSLNEVFVYVGFPLDKLDDNLKNYTTEVISEKEKLFIVQLDKPIPTEEYENWKIQMIQEADDRKKIEAEAKKDKDKKDDKSDDNAQRAQEETLPATANDVVREILAVNMLTLTPLQALTMMGEFQARLRLSDKLPY